MAMSADAACAHRHTLGDLQENKIPIFEREGWQSQPSLSKIGILLIRKSLDMNNT